MTQGGMEIKLKALTDMLPLLQITGNPPPDLGTRSFIYDTGSWKRENLLAGIEFFSKRTPTTHSPRAETWNAAEQAPYPCQP